MTKPPILDTSDTPAAFCVFGEVVVRRADLEKDEIMAFNEGTDSVGETKSEDIAII